MTTTTTEKVDRVNGTRPQHTHRCSQGHDWQCNSPYCEDMVRDCVPHGGIEPVVQGHEPGRWGR